MSNPVQVPKAIETPDLNALDATSKDGQEANTQLQPSTRRLIGVIVTVLFSEDLECSGRDVKPLVVIGQEDAFLG